MAEYGGNPIGISTDVDEYGNPTGHGGAGHVGAGPEGAGVGHLSAGYSDPGDGQVSGVTLRRSGSSSSSSSSEDDGQGGRRKKTLKDKVKEKLPGGAGKEHQEQGIPSAGQGATGAHEPEKKGFVQKIKEKLPGSH